MSAAARSITGRRLSGVRQIKTAFDTIESVFDPVEAGGMFGESDLNLCEIDFDATDPCFQIRDIAAKCVERPADVAKMLKNKVFSFSGHVWSFSYH